MQYFAYGSIKWYFKLFKTYLYKYLGHNCCYFQISRKTFLRAWSRTVKQLKSLQMGQIILYRIVYRSRHLIGWTTLLCKTQDFSQLRKLQKSSHQEGLPCLGHFLAQHRLILAERNVMILCITHNDFDHSTLWYLSVLSGSACTSWTASACRWVNSFNTLLAW